VLTRGDTIHAEETWAKGRTYTHLKEEVDALPVGTRVLELDERHHAWDKVSEGEWVCASTKAHAHPFPAWASVVVTFIPRRSRAAQTR